jgi:hypothetical protein
MPRACQIGPLSGRHDARSWVEPKREFPAPNVVHNAMVKEPLDMRKVWTSAARPGAMDAYRLPSHGTRC